MDTDLTDVTSSAFFAGLSTGLGIALTMIALIWAVDWLPMTASWAPPVEYIWAVTGAILLVAGYLLYNQAGAEQATLEATITDTHDGS